MENLVLSYDSAEILQIDMSHRTSNDPSSGTKCEVVTKIVYCWKCLHNPARIFKLVKSIVHQSMFLLSSTSIMLFSLKMLKLA